MAGNVMIRHGERGYFLSGVAVVAGRPSGVIRTCPVSSGALLLENEQIASAVINFISDAIDFEFAEELEIIVIPEVTDL